MTAVSETDTSAMSEAAATLTAPPVPEELCGLKGEHSYRTKQAESCVFLKNHEGSHTWQ